MISPNNPSKHEGPVHEVTLRRTSLHLLASGSMSSIVAKQDFISENFPAQQLKLEEHPSALLITVKHLNSPTRGLSSS